MIVQVLFFHFPLCLQFLPDVVMNDEAGKSIKLQIQQMIEFRKMMAIAGGQEQTGVIEGLISFLLISPALCILPVCDSCVER